MTGKINLSRIVGLVVGFVGNVCLMSGMPWIQGNALGQLAVWRRAAISGTPCLVPTGHNRCQSTLVLVADLLVWALHLG
jgi:hypothetical protein